ncbi:hypothetical protein DPMN_155889 [Dreissena polymorpha]|uniref:Uncharacterized protein n=1 Tax=Dreissena polymorpha TaxID=45954 RepID=A0A9D4FQ81_DREPO|nr:hypothetical protein DPMN_155889 [Dreissena polymorpha]
MQTCNIESVSSVKVIGKHGLLQSPRRVVVPFSHKQSLPSQENPTRFGGDLIQLCWFQLNFCAEVGISISKPK